MKINNTDVVIIGAGPAGSVAAALLRQNGVKVTILEACKFPRFSIGESLLPQSMDILEQAKVLDKVRHAKFQFKNGAAFLHKNIKSVIDFSESFTDGYDSTFEVKRAEFDQILASHANELGADILFEHKVTKIHENNDHIQVDYVSNHGVESSIKANFLFDASGFGRVLPRLLDLDKASDFPERKAIFSHIVDNITCGQKFDRNKILINISDYNSNIWYWLIPFSDGTSSIGVVGKPEELAGFGETDEARLAYLLANESNLKCLLTDFSYTRPIASMIGYSCGVKTLFGQRFALLGNAGEFLDPVFSSGITIALKSAQLAVDCYLRQTQNQVVNWQIEYADKLMVGVDTFRAFVESWYEGVLPKIILNQPKDKNEIKNMIISILAGYAWDTNNKFTKHGKKMLKLLGETI